LSRGFRFGGFPPACPPSYGAPDCYPGRSVSCWTQQPFLDAQPYRLVSSHTAQASDNASARIRGCPTGSGANLDVTAAEPATEMTSVAAVAPAKVVSTSPTFLHHSLRRLADGSRPPTPQGSQSAFAGGDATPIRPITGRPSLAPSSLTRSPVGSPCGSLSLAGGLRAYHVPLTQPSGFGRASGPVARHLRPGTVESRHLATHLLVQACQPLQGPRQRDPTWLDERHRPHGTSPKVDLTTPSWFPTAVRLAVAVSAHAYAASPEVLRLRCPAGFTPRRCQRRTLR
jgi:hypothetical protein